MLIYCFILIMMICHKPMLRVSCAGTGEDWSASARYVPGLASQEEAEENLQ